jgi:hypothetical protein
MKKGITEQVLFFKKISYEIKKRLSQNKWAAFFHCLLIGITFTHIFSLLTKS